MKKMIGVTMVLAGVCALTGCSASVKVDSKPSKTPTPTVSPSATPSPSPSSVPVPTATYDDATQRYLLRLESVDPALTDPDVKALVIGRGICQAKESGATESGVIQYVQDAYRLLRVDVSAEKARDVIAIADEEVC